MKIRVDTIFFFLFIVAFLVEGVLAEGVACSCLLSIWVLDRKKNKLIIGKQLYGKSLLFICFYLTLFIIHLYIDDCPNIIRFYGLTKCICTPALVLLVFPNICKEEKTILTIILLTMVYNMIYGISGLKEGVVLEDICYQFGSYNGCSGIAVILFPIVFSMFHLCSQKSFEKYLLILYFFSTFFVVYISESLTTQVILSFQLLILFFTSKRVKNIIKRHTKLICVCVVFALALISIFIANNTIELDPTALRTRADIWSTAYKSFVSQNIINIVLGGGDCWVQMESKVLQAHNAFIEILLIYGIVGLLFFVISCIYFFKNIFTRNLGHQSVYLCLSIISYFLFCFMHPFYTGVFAFQIICVLGMLYLLVNTLRMSVKYSKLSRND